MEEIKKNKKKINLLKIMWIFYEWRFPEEQRNKQRADSLADHALILIFP